MSSMVWGLHSFSILMDVLLPSGVCHSSLSTSGLKTKISFHRNKELSHLVAHGPWKAGRQVRGRDLPWLLEGSGSNMYFGSEILNKTVFLIGSC